MHAMTYEQEWYFSNFNSMVSGDSCQRVAPTLVLRPVSATARYAQMLGPGQQAEVDESSRARSLARS